MRRSEWGGQGRMQLNSGRSSAEDSFNLIPTRTHSLFPISFCSHTLHSLFFFHTSRNTLQFVFVFLYISHSFPPKSSSSSSSSSSLPLSLHTTSLQHPTSPPLLPLFFFLTPSPIPLSTPTPTIRCIASWGPFPVCVCVVVAV